VLRIIIGIALLSLVTLAFVGPRTPLAWMGLVGLVPLVVGLTGY
jgi:cadmium resistance protein CadD (predicted permease)